jgi:predicted HTH domain antitoxin
MDRDVVHWEIIVGGLVALDSQGLRTPRTSSSVKTRKTVRTGGKLCTEARGVVVSNFRKAGSFVFIAYIAYIMGTISSRIPDELEDDLQSYIEEENLDKSTAVRKLLTEKLDEWRKEKALEKLEAGETTLSGAAAIAEMNVWEFATLAKNRNVTWVSDDHLESDLENL